MAGPVSEEPDRSGRLTNSAARTDVVLLIRRTVRPLAPPGVGTLLRAVGHPPRCHPPFQIVFGNWKVVR